MVTEGRITPRRRYSRRAWSATTSSLRRQDRVAPPLQGRRERVKAGFECGIGFERFNDIKLGDLIEVFFKGAWRSRREPQGSRPDRVADQIRRRAAPICWPATVPIRHRFVTLTRVGSHRIFQQARVLYTVLGDEKGPGRQRPCARTRGAVSQAQASAHDFVQADPNHLQHLSTDSIAGQDRIEQILNELHSGEHDPDHDSRSSRAIADAFAPGRKFRSAHRALPDGDAVWIVLAMALHAAALG